MNDNSEFKTDSKKLTLYYGKYKYRVGIKFSEPNFKFWRHPGARIKFIEDELLLKIHDNFDDFKKQIKDTNLDVKIRLYFNSIDCYFNDLCVANLLSVNFEEHYDNALKLKITDIPYETDVIYHVNPIHKYRIYLKEQRYDTNSKDKLFEFIKNNKCYPSYSLIRWLTVVDNRSSWCWRHYSFDLDDEQYVTMISLKFPNLIRKVCRIESK